MRPGSLAPALLLLLSPTALRAAPSSPESLVAAERIAVGRVAMLDGRWRGPGWIVTPQGRKEIIHTARVGPMLDGSVRMIESRSYNPDGSDAFNGLGILSYDPATDSYGYRGYYQGRSGEFPIRMTDKGYVWEMPAEAGAIIRYTAVIDKDNWQEVGEYLAGGAPAREIYRVNLKRVGPTRWPSGDPIPMK
jgi:hypothetical protein